jgi:hypothetical protein
MPRGSTALVRLMALVAIGATAGACTSTVADPGTRPAISTVAPSPATSAAAVVSPSPTTPPATDDPAVHLVGLGDSVAGAGHCGECRSYVVVLGELAAKALGEPVITTNLGRNDDLTSSRLDSFVKSDETVRAAIAQADILTIGIGWNDWQGPCSWTGHAACLANGQTSVERNLGLILDEVATLRAGAPTAIRVVTYADTYVGDPQTPVYWGLPATTENQTRVENMFSTALTDFNAMLCAVATAHDAICVDVVPAFNGTSGTTPIAPELRESQAQMDLIAATIDAAGYAPLH